jgi:two-component system sensor histidine kinase MtrB
MSTAPTPIHAGRLRRRLATAFVLVGGVSAGSLAVGSYLVVRHSLLSDSTNRALTQAHVNLGLARSTLHGGPADLTTLLRLYASRPGFVTVAVLGGRHSTGTLPIPASLRSQVARRNVAYQRETVAGTPYLVVGTPTAQRGTTLYFYFDEHGVWHDLGVLERILAAGWIVLVLISGVVGTLLARRTLAPVAQASAAARWPRACSTPACREAARTSSAPGRRRSTAWPRRCRRRSPSSQRRASASGGSQPTSPTSCARP